jgi:hypothetical protein
VVSKHSLKSEPCREELNYALHRALESRGSTFPLIGIFVEQVDKQLIPAAIATRLYVNIEAQDWLERVRSGVECALPNSRAEAIAPVATKLYRNQDRYELIVEARPRAGLWKPCVAKVLLSEKDEAMLLLINLRHRYSAHRRLALRNGASASSSEFILTQRAKPDGVQQSQPMDRVGSLPEVFSCGLVLVDLAPKCASQMVT